MLLIFAEELKGVDVLDSDALSFRFVETIFSPLDHHALLVQWKTWTWSFHKAYSRLKAQTCFLELLDIFAAQSIACLQLYRVLLHSFRLVWLKKIAVFIL